MLFDGGVKAIKRAKMQFKSQNRLGFVNETERAYLIVGELLATLDMEQGKLPRTLSGIYAYYMRCIVESRLGDMSKLDEAKLHATRIGEAGNASTAGYRAENAPGRPTEAAA